MCVAHTQGLFIWVNRAGDGRDWVAVDLTSAHNRGLNASDSRRFTSLVNESEGWQAQAEVGLIATGPHEALITYNKYGTPPAGGSPSGGSIAFSMRLKFAAQPRATVRTEQ